MASESFCEKYGCDTATVATLFIPNTYDIYWNITLDHFMERMQKEHKRFWTAQRLEKAKAMGLTPAEVATMASIIDEETANNAEKPMVAGMYYNRLKAGMPLQADPTIKFAWKDFALRRIYNKLLSIDSPYNTYKNTVIASRPNQDCVGERHRRRAEPCQPRLYVHVRQGRLLRHAQLRKNL